MITLRIKANPCRACGRRGKHEALPHSVNFESRLLAVETALALVRLQEVAGGDRLEFLDDGRLMVTWYVRPGGTISPSWPVDHDDGRKAA